MGWCRRMARGTRPLQRCRRQETTERQRRPEPTAGHGWASTVPPSGDDGETVQESARPPRLPASTVPPSGDDGERWGRWALRLEEAGHPLQRCRRQETTERARSRRSARGSIRRSFNGAAVRRRRRGATRPWPTCPPRSGSNGAAVRRRRRGRPRGSCARTRSRSFNGAAVRRRRRGASPLPTSPRMPSLQRCRRQETTERRRPTRWRCSCRACGFNGAAVRRRRRGGQAHRRGVRHRQASTVPPSGDDGEPDAPRIHRRGGVASTVPPSGDDGERPRRRGPCRTGRAGFNGAAVRRRRRVQLPRRAGRTRSTCFNGAAVRVTVQPGEEAADLDHLGIRDRHADHDVIS